MLLSRTSTRVAAATSVVVVAFSAGLLTGVMGSHDPDSTAAASVAAPSEAAASSGVLDQAANTILQNAAKPISKDDLDKAAVEGMLQALNDKWSSYYTPSDFDSFQDVMNGEYTGVGLWVQRSDAGVVSVVSVQTGSASDGALRSGDVITAVGGTPVATRSTADVVAALRGQAGTTVTVTYLRADATHTVSLKRTALPTEDVTAKVTGSVMVIKVSAFTKGVGDKVAQFVATARNRHLSGIVLDLRGNPGGLLDEGVKTASVFLDGGPVVTFEKRGAPPLLMTAEPGGDTGTPLAVLVDGGTASAAEVVTAALQDRDRAVVVGSRTFGKGSVQEPTILSDGSAIEFTVGNYLTPSGKSLDGVGIGPDVTVPAGATPAAAEAQAVEVLSGLLADAGTGGRG
ncbi:MAG TPA: S41 family peptidase [Acidothermaceae bacterium]|nr:S41 family peptidase [Acidothermaceae bacterium]